MISSVVHVAPIMAKYLPYRGIFLPSKNGISHNTKEYTSIDELETGAHVLLKNNIDFNE